VVPQSFEGNRVVRDAGCRHPIFNAGVGYFARAQLAGAVSAAGGMGLMETNTLDLAGTQAEYERARAMGDAPVALQMFLRVLKDQGRVDEVLDWILDGRTPLVVTCVGDPAPITARAHDAGVTHYHQVGSLTEARKAVDAGVDGLIVEGAESGGLRHVRSPHLFTLLQQVRAAVDVPIVAAGGIADGHGMAGAFALGAEGIFMGTRFMSSVESPVHANWKEAIADTDVTLNVQPGNPNIRMRVARTELAEAVFRGEVDPAGNPYAGPVLEAIENGRLDLAMVGCGESASLIDSVKSVREIIDETLTTFWAEIARLARLLGTARPPEDVDAGHR
jgi:enoyl-[acyl-carrier protein] reductase II